MRFLRVWRDWARTLKREVHALYLACRDPRTPWYAKLVAGLVAAYALSPIDLIPDPIPIIGYLDDLLLLPLGIWFAIRLVPAEVMEDCRIQAEQAQEKPTSRWMVGVVVIVWLLTLVALSWLLNQYFNPEE